MDLSSDVDMDFTFDENPRVASDEDSNSMLDSDLDCGASSTKHNTSDPQCEA